jgi:hypothetical protein
VALTDPTLTPRRVLSRVPPLLAEVYAKASAGLKVKLLECLLKPVGPLGLVAIAAGAFGAQLQRGGYRRPAVSLEDAATVTSDQLLELARYVEQSSPDTFVQVAALLNDGAGGAAAGLSAMLVVSLVQRWRRR